MVVRTPPRIVNACTTCVTLGSLMLASSAGCAPDFNELTKGTGGSAGHLTGGAAGSAGSSGTSGTSAGSSGTTAGSAGSVGGGGTAGSAGSAGDGGTAGSAGSAAGDGGTAGSAGSTSGSGGTAGSSGSTSGSGGTSGGSGDAGATCTGSTMMCGGAGGCTDLNVGDAQGITVNNCGSCGVTCATTNASSASCKSGACSPACKTGFGDCNPQATNDGCETDITSTDNCGKCGYPCSHNGATDLACTFGRCQPTCAAFLGNCNATATLAADDGCETYLESQTQCRPNCTTAGVACGPLQVCNAGQCGAAQGVTVLSVPLTMAGQDQRFADLFMPPLDLTNAQFVLRLYAPGATGGQLLCYFSDTNSAAGGGGTLQLTDYAAGWKEATFNVGATTATFNTTSIKQLTMEVVSGTSTSWAPNPMVIYVDLVRSTNGFVNDTFNTSTGNMFKSSTQMVAGSTMTWADALP